MVHPEDAHVGAAAGAALLDGFGGHVEDVHEGNGAGGHALGGHDRVVGRADAGEGEAGAAAGLVDQGGLLDGVEDGFDVVLDGQDEAGGELAQLAAGVHQGGGVGHEAQARHHLIKLFGDGVHVGLGVVVPVDGGDGLRHAAEHLLGRLRGLALFVLLQVAFFQHDHGVGG